MNQEELADEVGKLAGETSGPDRHVVQSISHLIRSNARVEESIKNFSSNTRRTEKIMIGLAIAQVLLALATIYFTGRIN